MSKYPFKPLSPKNLKTYSLKSRQSKVAAKNFARTGLSGQTVADFIENLPDILAGKDFKIFIETIKKARAAQKPVIFGLGAHVIKVGLNPVIIDLMDQGWITAIAMNGAGIIHDFEIAFSGQTSEDVQIQLEDGRFGMAKETGDMLNEAISSAGEDIGLGEAVGRMITDSDLRFKDLSILGRAYDSAIPVTVHVAIGTDIIHFHPKVNGEALGRVSLRDFFLLCSIIELLNDGGIFINIGSAVILPEVFLKAISFVRNKGISLDGFSTAVFDFIHHYRPCQNVVKRPVSGKGKGFYFIGHHELMIPLLAAALKC